MNKSITLPTPDIGPGHPRWTDTLRDHSQVTIRPITAGDAERERAFIEGLSPAARRFRFLGQLGVPGDALVHQLTDVDQVHHVAFAAVVPMGDDERFVGTCRYSISRDEAGGECAVTVDDEWQNKGLGTILMKHLIGIARERGVTRLYSVDSAGNRAMKDLAFHLGFHTRPDPADASQLIHELELQTRA
ncbi:GNAT family N-acetyltransferase [Marilutibacter chinensis]|uniref:GNAT family N-acetyltransferase n=1 Tax=Marilutibacter chinensis TaxID=2912247 RepID=A0ABS9HMV8_9GAMM|nr:GNAT family N-acetyltransferase [Lysobacter chinensis]MCF7220349.1 GNAT family N-acetyltransferase [Lysobacter chinensis]